jgi:23S rRNA (uracil1939-C5)-methyltransferase
MRLDLTINELSPGGEGVGICEVGGERRAVFVPNVLRGEVVRVEVADPKQRPLRGRVLEVLAESASRRVPACAFVDRCGGCDWMHLEPNEQVAEHGRLVAKLLKYESVVSHAAPKDVGYRSRARVHVETRRRDQVLVGMFARRSHEPAVVDTCLILDPIVERARLKVASWLMGAKGKGEATLSLGDPRQAPRRAVMDLMWNGDDLPPELFGRLEKAVLAKDGEIAGARVFAGEVRVPAKIGDPTPFIVGADGEPLRLPPGGFSQATEEGNALLAKRVATVVGELGGDSIVTELYAGAGNLTVLLARRSGHVIAVESDREACVAAKENLSARSLSAKIVEGDASTFAIPKGTAIVVLDPPREGARKVATTLAEHRAKRPKSAPSIVYVSCDAPTLARDVEILTASGYRLSTVETFEMFPQTSHVETLAVLVPSTSS